MDVVRRYFKLYQQGGSRAVAAAVASHFCHRSVFSGFIRSHWGKAAAEKPENYFRLGYWPQIQEPRSFNEKILHRKLFTDNPLYSLVEDKWAVREYVREKVGEDILPEVYFVTDEHDGIPFDELPNKFAIKATHGSGWIEIVDDKETTDLDKIQEKCNNWLSQQYSNKSRGQYWYSEIKPRVIVEERLESAERTVPRDYKFFVFHGEVKYIQVDFARFSNHSRRFFTPEWQPQEFALEYPLGPVIDAPNKLDRMIKIAEALGDDFDFVRIDLYQPDEDTVIFGEMTIGPGAGQERFSPVKYDFKLGELW